MRYIEHKKQKEENPFILSVGDLTVPVWYLSFPESRTMLHLNLLLLQQWLSASRASSCVDYCDRICDRSCVRFLSWIITEVVSSAYDRSYDRSPFTTFR